MPEDIQSYLLPNLNILVNLNFIACPIVQNVHIYIYRKNNTNLFPKAFLTIWLYGCSNWGGAFNGIKKVIAY